ncbi:MAG: hypothetical protein A2Y38_01650 [Spirochaetes bacterium GWB1_59_5]|nr:MAG: hypothetical protein A2Y38_01650 [Spirochaetes bacterium GWB1_59_5]
MATEQKILDMTYEAGEDLSSDQYRFVMLGSDGKVRRPDSVTEVAHGVLQNAPDASGKAAVVRIIGISKVQAGGAVALGDFVVAEYVGAADAGKGIASAAAYNHARGICVEAASAEDDLAGVLLLDPDEKKHQISVALPALTANTSVYCGVMAIQRAIKITAISICVVTVPVDSDGTVVMAVENYDASGSALDNLLSAATADLEGLTANTPSDLALTATAADLLLADADFIRVRMTNDSAAIDTAMAGGVLTVEFEIIP